MRRHVPLKGHRGIYYSERANGTRTYEVRYVDSEGKQRFEACGDRLKDALERQAQIRVSLGKGERVAPSRKTYGEVADEWKRQRQVSPKTAENYDRSLRLYVLPRFGRRKIQEITTDSVAAFLSELPERLSDSTKTQVYIATRQVFSYAVNPRRGYIQVNPCSGLERGERPKPKKNSVRILESGEAERLILASTPWLRPIIQTAMLSGMRIGEIQALRWEDVNFAKNELTVKSSLGRDSELGPTKNRKVRVIPLLPALRKILAEQPSRFAGGFVFQHEDQPLPYSKIVSSFGRARKRARLSEVPRVLTLHDLRHTFASILLRDGRDIGWVSELLGHSDTKVTLETYAHVIYRENRAEEAAQRLSEALGRWAT